jgi:hypothetical protein
MKLIVKHSETSVGMRISLRGMGKLVCPYSCQSNKGKLVSVPAANPPFSQPQPVYALHTADHRRSTTVRPHRTTVSHRRWFSPILRKTGPIVTPSVPFIHYNTTTRAAGFSLRDHS